MLKTIVEPLTEWYENNHRELPWRMKKNPYEIWVSEVMLQQTRVEAVKPYYERFIRALPDVRALAEVPEDELLKLWEGLGYYNRVRNMQKAAVILCEKYEGRLPEDYEKLRALPGIGSYTAGAIASIAYEIPVPAVDGNVLRVLARIQADAGDIMKQSVRSRVEKELSEIMPKGRSGSFNQALMELGAMVCIPNGAPLCEKCPVFHLCEARKKGMTDIYPVKGKKAKRRVEKRTVFLIMDGRHAAVRKRPDRGLLAGLYEFPNTEGWLKEEEALSYVKKKGLMPLQIRSLPAAKHVFSHVEWNMTGYLIRVAEPEQQMNDDMFFVDTREAQEKYAVPAAFSAYAGYLNLRLGQDKYQDKKEKKEKES